MKTNKALEEKISKMGTEMGHWLTGEMLRMTAPENRPGHNPTPSLEEIQELDRKIREKLTGILMNKFSVEELVEWHVDKLESSIKMAVSSHIIKSLFTPNPPIS